MRQISAVKGTSGADHPKARRGKKFSNPFLSLMYLAGKIKVTIPKLQSWITGSLMAPTSVVDRVKSNIYLIVASVRYLLSA